MAKELQDRAIQFVEKRNTELKQEFLDLGGEAAILDIDGMQMQLAAKLAKSDVKTLDDLAGLASDELMELAEDLQLSQDVADAIILKAREPWFAQAK